jgi:hypothetical protein
LRTAFAFKAGFLWGAFFFADFFLETTLFLLLASFFLTSFRTSFTFLLGDLFEVDFAGFFLVFFFAAICAVYHRHTRSMKADKLYVYLRFKLSSPTSAASTVDSLKCGSIRGKTEQPPC